MTDSGPPSPVRWPLSPRRRAGGYRLVNLRPATEQSGGNDLLRRWLNSDPSFIRTGLCSGYTALAVLAFLVFTAVLTFATIATAKYSIARIPHQTTDFNAARQQDYHLQRLLVTLHEHPSEHARAEGNVLPGVLELKEVIDNSARGDKSKGETKADDLIYVGHVPEGEDAADYLDSVLGHEGVKHVELDAYMFTHATRTVAYQRPDDTFYVCNGAGECGGPGASRHLPGQQWGLGQISAPQAWSVTKGSKGVKVGVIDTGISLNHQDLQRNINKDCQDFVNGDDSCDEGRISGNSKGHGTFIAGGIAADSNNSQGVAGMAWNVDVVGCTMFSDHCSGESCKGSTSAAIKCLNWLRNERGVRIIANSYGCSAASVSSCYSAQFEKAIRAFKDQGGLFVVSAGNDGTDNDKIKHYPAGYLVDNMLAVTGTSVRRGAVWWDAANPEHLADHVNWGGRTVHLAAPGQDIISTWAPGSNMCRDTQTGKPDPACYARITGTSAAVPFVAGAAALIASMPNAPRDGVAIKELILQHADSLPWLKGVVSSGSRLNAFKPLHALAKRAGTKLAEAAPGSSPPRKSEKPKPPRKQAGGGGRRLLDQSPEDVALLRQLRWERRQREQLLGVNSGTARRRRS